MTDINIKVDGATAAKVSQEGILTTGMVGATATFVFDDVWDGLAKTAVFRGGGVVRDVIGIVDVVRIPPETLRKDGLLYAGVEGRDSDGEIVIPTTWVKAAYIWPGANASGDPSTDPELEVWAQILAMIGDLTALGTVDKTTLVAAINEALQSGGGGTVDEETVTRLVDEYLAEVSPEEIGAIPAPTTAQVGQTIVVTEVDEGGRPVSWECVDVAGEVWKMLREFKIPADPSTDTSGITWITDEEGNVTGFEFDTDADGNPFECSGLSITTSGTCIAAGGVYFVLNGVRVIGHSTFQTEGARASWGKIHKRNGVWRWVGGYGATMRYVHDKQTVYMTGFVGSPKTDFDTFTKFGVEGTKGFTSAYSFGIWGRCKA